MRRYIEGHPCFYLEELQTELLESFPNLENVSISTVCRALRHDIKMTRKTIEKRARQARPEEMESLQCRLKPFYHFPQQLVFIDETSKDGRAAVRRYGYSTVGTPLVVRLAFDRGQRISTLAAFNSKGFFGWTHTSGTYSRKKFHNAFLQNILPHLNPWPMHNSNVILDNAKIHMYEKLEEAIHNRGALLFYLPPYSPHVNPIEYGFSLVKKYIQKHGNLAFNHQPELALNVALGMCASEGNKALNQVEVEHCGYGNQTLIMKH